MALCTCLSCGRHIDCDPTQICELCQVDFPLMAGWQRPKSPVQELIDQHLDRPQESIDQWEERVKEQVRQEYAAGGHQLWPTETPEEFIEVTVPEPIQWANDEVFDPFYGETIPHPTGATEDNFRSRNGFTPEVDITGTMAKPVDNWQERVEALCKPENFLVTINGSSDVADALSPEELGRLLKKLKLVARYTQYMAAGMLKGTIKYPDDGYTLDKWMAHLIGEGADQSNYSILLADAYYKGR